LRRSADADVPHGGDNRPHATAADAGRQAHAAADAVGFRERSRLALGGASRSHLRERGVPAFTTVRLTAPADVTISVRRAAATVATLSRQLPAGDSRIELPALAAEIRMRACVLIAVLACAWSAVICSTALGAAVNLYSAGGTDSGPSDITAGPDGALWWGDLGKIGRITVDGHVSGFTASLPRDAVIGDLTLGPDGRIWFTERPYSRIGAITPTGTVTQYRLPSDRVGPFPFPVVVTPTSLAFGSDGALWFTQLYNAAIGRMTVDGRIGHYTRGIRSDALDIAAGPDGALWFTSNKEGLGIGRITTAGQVSYFSRGLRGEPGFIVSGPDGNLWFTARTEYRDFIGRITPAGAVTRFMRGTSRAFMIGAGPTADIWFSRPTTSHDDPYEEDDSLGRIKADGRVTPFFGGAFVRSQISGITTGPDGNLWFTEMPANDGGHVGRLDLDACGGTRRVVLELRARWPRLAAAKVWLDGRRVHVAKRTLRAVIDLRLHAAGTAVVRVAGRTRAGRSVHARRTFTICGGE
jgi:virginiamycin B lyase